MSGIDEKYWSQSDGSKKPQWRKRGTQTPRPATAGAGRDGEQGSTEMALKGASTTVDADYIDWAGLAEENAAVVCTVKEILPPKDYGNGEVAAVRARVIVLTGKQAGTVYEDERILKAGIRNKLQEVGDDVVGRLDVYGARKAVGLQAEHAGDVELAEKALAKFGSGSVPAQRSEAKADTSGDDEPPF